MNTDYIMDYTPFELIYEGIRHTTVEEHAKDWNLTFEQIETLKEKLLKRENNIYETWLHNLPHLPLPSSDWYIEKGFRLGACAFHMIAYDLIKEVGNAELMLDNNIFPALNKYAKEIKTLIRNFDINTYEPNISTYMAPDKKDALINELFDEGWRPSLATVEFRFCMHIMGLQELREVTAILDRKYIAWMRSKIFEMDFKISKLNESTANYEKQRMRLINWCAFEVAYDMACENFQVPKYRYQIERYEDILSPEWQTIDIYEKVVQLLDTRNITKLIDGTLELRKLTL